LYYKHFNRGEYGRAGRRQTEGARGELFRTLVLDREEGSNVPNWFSTILTPAASFNEKKEDRTEGGGVNSSKLTATEIASGTGN